MYIVYRIRIYNNITKLTESTIITTQVFGFLHQVEQYRGDFETYKRLHGNNELYVYFTIECHKTP